MRDWEIISQNLTNRSAKTCLDRYINHLQPNLKTDNWSKEEDDNLLKLVETYGNKWKIISGILSGRSPISIKKRFVNFLSKNVDSEKNITRVNICRIARLVLPPDFDEKKNLEFPIHKDIGNLFEEVFQNEFNALDFVFDDF
jgi:hypothetical protein